MDVIPLDDRNRLDEDHRGLVPDLLRLAGPVLVEQFLHMAVGLTDTWVANHLPTDSAAAGAAVGTISYLMWFMGILAGSIATGSTAIIARATGARHKRLANSVCGQSISGALVMGGLACVLVILFARLVVRVTALQGPAADLAHSYLLLMGAILPFTMLIFVASACLRGAGNTLAPAIVWVVVDLLNIFLTVSLTRGLFGLPNLGFAGIAWGTAIAYAVGGTAIMVVLVTGRGGLKLYWHRLRPHWLTIKRLLRIGIPSGLESSQMWLVNFVMIVIINRNDSLGGLNTMQAAHNIAVRLEGLSFMPGFAFAIAAATMVGQSLGAKRPARAARSAYAAYFLGGGIMTFFGIVFILFGHELAKLMSNNPEIERLAGRCLFITGFAQCGFAASIIFSSALRGAGDTMAVMIRNLSSLILVRLLGVIVVAGWLKMGLDVVWIVLACELMIRGTLMWARFARGKWKQVEV